MRKFEALKTYAELAWAGYRRLTRQEHRKSYYIIF